MSQEIKNIVELSQDELNTVTGGCSGVAQVEASMTPEQRESLELGKAYNRSAGIQ